MYDHETEQWRKQACQHLLNACGELWGAVRLGVQGGHQGARALDQRQQRGSRVDVRPSHKLMPLQGLRPWPGIWVLYGHRSMMLRREAPAQGNL